MLGTVRLVSPINHREPFKSVVLFDGRDEAVCFLDRPLDLKPGDRIQCDVELAPDGLYEASYFKVLK